MYIARMSTATKAAVHDPLLHLDEQLCFAIYSAGLAMNKVYRRALQDLELTYPQYLVLLVLWEADGQTVSALGKRLGLDSATLTPLLKRLEAAGLISRERDRADERSVIIGLTPAGRKLRTRAHTVPQCIFDAAGCSLEDARSLKTGLETLRTHLLASLE
jgi:DNA-binding MarR family transcriptional regulator